MFYDEAQEQILIKFIQEKIKGGQLPAEIEQVYVDLLQEKEIQMLAHQNKLATRSTLNKEI